MVPSTLIFLLNIFALHSYHVVQQLKTFSQARAYCASTYNSDLITITDATTNGNIFNDITQDSLIGYNDIDTEGTFKWIGGSDSTYTKWELPWQPDDYGTGEDCVAMKIDNGTWNDVPCNLKYHFICEDAPSMNPSVAPTIYPSTTPTMNPTSNPSTNPSKNPTYTPSIDPTSNPSFNPTAPPSNDPTGAPTANPSIDPTSNPTTISPTETPTKSPTLNPTDNPSKNPSFSPSTDPTGKPSANPTSAPSIYPTGNPSTNPTSAPSTDPTNNPSKKPTRHPTIVSTQDGQFGEGEVSEKRGKNYTISITVEDCSSESCVEWLKDDMMQRTQVVLNDDLNQEVVIKKTEVDGNVLVSVVTVLTDLFVALETEPIAERIETELEDDGYDVEVEMIETDKYTDSDSLEAEEPSIDLLGYGVMGLIVILCLCIVVLLVLYCRKRKQVVTVVKNMTAERMSEEPNGQTTAQSKLSNVQMASAGESNTDVTEEVTNPNTITPCTGSRSMDNAESKRKETASDSDAKQTDDICTAVGVVPGDQEQSESQSQSQSQEGLFEKKHVVSSSEAMYVDMGHEETEGNTETDDQTKGETDGTSPVFETPEDFNDV